MSDPYAEVMKARKEARTPSIELLKREFNLVQHSRKTVWTHQAVVAYMARDMDFYVTGEFKTTVTPLQGFCLRCGGVTLEGKGPRWDAIMRGQGACNSHACGGNQMPTEDFMTKTFRDRGCKRAQSGIP